MLDCPPARPSWTILVLRIEQKPATTPMRRSESLRQTLKPSAKTVIYGRKLASVRPQTAVFRGLSVTCLVDPWCSYGDRLVRSARTVGEGRADGGSGMRKGWRLPAAASFTRQGGVRLVGGERRERGCRPRPRTRRKP